MKVVILAGGKGTRISEESILKPKPMIEIGGIPILHHIMNIYSSNGFNDFIICAGYKQNKIKEYFSHLNFICNDVTFDLKTGDSTILNSTNKLNWKITICDTGLNSQTGERIKQVRKYLGNEPFLLTYGDAVGNINIKKTIEVHKKSNRIVTICTYHFAQSKGIVSINKQGDVLDFKEKAAFNHDLINIGFMVVDPKIFKYINKRNSNLEKDVLEKLAKVNQVNSYLHKGFWQCMDTLKEKEMLENLWNSNKCPWR